METKMLLLHLFAFVTMVLIITVSCTIQTDFNQFIFGKTICCVTPVDVIFGMSPLDCVSQCLSKPDCTVISYQRKTLQCRLFHVEPNDRTFEEYDSSFIMAFVNQWSEDLLYPCSRHLCSSLSRCALSADGTPHCIISGEYSNQWTSIYETDNDGVVISGKLDDLKAAFRSAPDVRIYVPSWKQTFNIDSTNIINVDTKTSFCSQSLFHVVKKTWDTFSATAIRVFYLFCTTGFYQKKEYHFGSDSQPRYPDEIGFVGMKWFTRHFCEHTEKYPVFCSDEQAQQCCTSLSKLISQIRHGSEIRLRTTGLVLHVNQITFNPSMVIALSHRRLQTEKYRHSDGIDIRKLKDYWIYYNYGSEGTMNKHLWSVGTHHLEKITTKIQRFVDFYSDICWSLVYSHDNSGDVLNGNIERLRASVLSGRRIRILVNSNMSGEPDSLFMGSNGLVTSQLLSQLSISKQSKFQFYPYTFWQMISSSGFANVMKMYIESNVAKSSETFKFNVIWFADTRAWRKLLAISDTGHVTMGSKDELSRSLKSGGMLRVLVTFQNGTISAFSPDSIEFYQEEVAAQFVRHVGHVQKSGSNERVFPVVPYWNYIMVTTEGKLISSLWIVGENVKVSDTSIMVKTVWFVN